MAGHPFPLGETSVEAEETLLVCDNADKRWCVIYTRSRREKKVASSCRQFGVRHYLPLRKSITGRRGRRYAAMVPIFPGYVFVYLDWADRQRLWQTRHIAKIIDVVDQNKFIEELKNISTVEKSGSFLHPVSAITKGKRIRIIDGPLYGLEGRISRIKGKNCVVLEVDIIQQGVACEIDASMVVPV